MVKVEETLVTGTHVPHAEMNRGIVVSGSHHHLGHHPGYVYSKLMGLLILFNTGSKLSVIPMLGLL